MLIRKDYFGLALGEEVLPNIISKREKLGPTRLKMVYPLREFKVFCQTKKIKRFGLVLLMESAGLALKRNNLIIFRWKKVYKGVCLPMDRTLNHRGDLCFLVEVMVLHFLIQMI